MGNWILAFIRLMKATFEDGQLDIGLHPVDESRF